MRRIPAASRAFLRPARAFVRAYSDRKYRAIEDFNNSRTEYNFHKPLEGIKDDEWGTSKASLNSAKIHQRVAEQMQNEEDMTVNEKLELDPRLAQFENGSPEYKEQLALIHEEYLRQQKEENKRWEYRERLKAAGLGIALIVGIVGAHNVFMNYEYYKNWLFQGTYGITEKPVVLKNRKNINHIAAKLDQLVDQEFIEALSPSEEVSGLYVFGSQNGAKYPVRIPSFNNMALKDVEVSGDLLVALADDGTVYQYLKGSSKPCQISLPFKVDKCAISKKKVYLLTNKGQVAYTPKLDAKQDFDAVSRRNWIGLKRSTNYNVLAFDNEGSSMLQKGEKLKDISAGDNHLLILSDKGRIFVSKTDDGDNFGQFGTPDYSPFAEGTIPVDKPVPLTSLNNEVVITKTQKYVRPRQFNHIAAGKFHNIASDIEGNIWAWGRNTSGECGIEVNYKNDIQAVPKKVLTKQNLVNAYRSIDTKIPVDDVLIEGLYANDETSILNIKMKNDDIDQNVIMTFGNGLKGQLGTNRFLHVCHKPQVVKSLINLSEFNEAENRLSTININDISTGCNHSFIKLGNSGARKDILSFGDNEAGQFGNGKIAKNSKPSGLPPLIEPEDFEHYSTDKPGVLKKLAKKLNDSSINRLQLSDVRINGVELEQTIKATDNTTVIFYKRK